MSELKPCPFCGELPIQFVKDGLTQIRCNNTQCWIVPATSFYTDRKTAVEAWEERAQPAACEIAEYAEDCKDCGFCVQPANEPLTLEQVKQATGEIWIFYPQETWGPQKADAKDLHCSAYAFPFDTYGTTLLAYDHKPGGKQDA